MSAVTVGAVLASRRPRHPVGWLLLAFGLSANASGVAQAYAHYALLARPGTLPAARSVALYLPATVVTALTLIGFVLLPTPTGSLPSSRWRWWAWVAAAAPVVSLLAITLAGQPFDRPYQETANPLELNGLGAGAPAHRPDTRAYLARRTAQGKRRRDAKRCLRRVIARQLFRQPERYGQPGVEVTTAT